MAKTFQCATSPSHSSTYYANLNNNQIFNNIALRVIAAANNVYKEVSAHEILIIDDDLQIARLLQLTLEREGIASEIAASAEFNKQLMWKMGLVCHKPLDASLPNVLRQFVNSCVKPG